MRGTCFYLAHMAEPLGMTVAGMNTWDLMRLIDYLEERGEWNTEHLGCVGVFWRRTSDAVSGCIG